MYLIGWSWTGLEKSLKNRNVRPMPTTNAVLDFASGRIIG
jgi:hypothetical protein